MLQVGKKIRVTKVLYRGRGYRAGGRGAGFIGGNEGVGSTGPVCNNDATGGSCSGICSNGATSGSHPIWVDHGPQRWASALLSGSRPTCVGRSPCATNLSLIATRAMLGQHSLLKKKK
ncbi:hypothetical protein SUGI_0640860 [Cryptomeria japonica]|nr:hypothetical protein SUGI_0640860 [Cryptomeria japonica]